MTKLTQTLQHWDTELFNQCLKLEIKTIESGVIPLQKATTQGGIVNESNLGITVLSHKENTNTINVHIGLFFTEIVPSCSCGDEPLEINNYCELELSINKSTAEANFTLIDDTN